MYKSRYPRTYSTIFYIYIYTDLYNQLNSLSNYDHNLVQQLGLYQALFPCTWVAAGDCSSRTLYWQTVVFNSVSDQFFPRPKRGRRKKQPVYMETGLKGIKNWRKNKQNCMHWITQVYQILETYKVLQSREK